MITCKKDDELCNRCGDKKKTSTVDDDDDDDDDDDHGDETRRDEIEEGIEKNNLKMGSNRNPPLLAQIRTSGKQEK